MKREEKREKRVPTQTHTYVCLLFGIRIVCRLALGRHHSLNEQFVASVKTFITVQPISIYLYYNDDDDVIMLAMCVR